MRVARSRYEHIGGVPGILSTHLGVYRSCLVIHVVSRGCLLEFPSVTTRFVRGFARRHA